MSELTRRRLLPRDERQAQILAAAAAAFARGGYSATSMEDVAREAGVTRLIVYRHFDSKEALYRAVLTQVTERLASEWEMGLAAHDRGFVFRTLLTVAREQPDAYRLLFVHASREPQFRTFAQDVQAVQVGLADELLGASIPDPAVRRWATRTVVGHLNASVLAWLEVGDATRDDEWLARATDTLHAVVVAATDPFGQPVP